MNTFTLRLASLALAAAAASSAFAESPEASAQAAVTVSTLDRAQVQSQARSAGLLTEDHLQRTDPLPGRLTRAQVQAETLVAAARGELPSAGELGVVPAGAAVRRPAAGPTLAALTR